jgi:hypothetical protein
MRAADSSSWNAAAPILDSAAVTTSLRLVHAGYWSQVRPSSRRPPALGVSPPICLKNSGTRILTQRSRRSRTQPRSSGRKSGPFPGLINDLVRRGIAVIAARPPRVSGRRPGNGSQVWPSSRRPPAFGVRPAHDHQSIPARSSDDTGRAAAPATRRLPERRVASQKVSDCWVQPARSSAPNADSARLLAALSLPVAERR